MAHFSANFLPFSQAFIHEELLGHRRYAMEAFAHTRFFPERFPFEPLTCIAPANHPAGHAESLLYQSTGFSPRIARRLRDGDFSLIHAQFGPGGFYALPYALWLDLPLICTFGGIDVAVLLPDMRWRRPDYWRYTLFSGTLFRRINRFLAVSADLATKLVALGADPDRVFVHHRGVHIPDSVERPVKNPEDPFEMLMVGRFVEKKGFETGLIAFARLVASGVNARLKLVGQGPLQGRYETLIREHRIDNRVAFVPHMSQEDLFRLYLSADVVCVPSVVGSDGDTEGIPNVVKEAGVRQAALVATRHGGIPEVIKDGVTGLLVPERDGEALFTALKRLANSPRLRQELGENARNHMQQTLSTAVRNEALEAHYDEVIEQWENR